MFKDKRQNLDILQEECAELIKIVSKIKRFGCASYHPYDPNKINNLDKMIQEMGDVIAMIKIIQKDYNISDHLIEKAQIKKVKKMLDFYNITTKNKPA